MLSTSEITKRRNSRSSLSIQKKERGGAFFLLLLLFVPLVTNAASPWRDLSFKLEAFLFGPPLLVKHLVTKGIYTFGNQVASLLTTEKNSKYQAPNHKQIPNPNDQISEPVIAIPSLSRGKQSPIQDTKYSIQDTQKVIVREKEIIREIVVKESQIPDTKYSIQDTNIGDKLAALRTELTDSFAKRINTLAGGFGFNTNRFDDLFVQKSLELQGKLNQPANVASSPVTFSSSITSKDISATSLSLSSTLTVSGTATSTISGALKIAGGLTAGSGNVQIIDSTGKIPALSSAYFATLPSLFSSIGNASSTVQFSASTASDVLSLEATGGLLTISFDSTTKKVTFNASAPTLLSVLNQGADASTFTGTTKIGGLTLTSSGDLTLTGALTISGSATSTFAGPLDIGSGKFSVLASSGNTTIQGTLTAASSLFQVNSSGFTLLPFGTSTTPSLAFTGDTDTGIFGKDNNILAFGTGGTERLRIDGSGNVGIGTINPTQKFQVNDTATSAFVVTSAGQVGIGTTSPTNGKLEISGTNILGAVLNRSATNAYNLLGYSTAGTMDWTVGTFEDANSDFRIYSYGTASNVLYIKRSSGNVGIGTTGPADKLHVEGSEPAIRLRGTRDDAGAAPSAWRFITLSYADGDTVPMALTIQEGVNSLVTIKSSGNVGIGETNPGFKLHVTGTAGSVARFNAPTDGTLVDFASANSGQGTISLAGSIVSYNAFTGSHYAWTDGEIERGMLVSMTGNNRYNHDNPQSEIIYGITKSTTPNDPKILGAYLSLLEPNKPSATSTNPHLVMAVGNADMWVVDMGQNLEAGDYLISSAVPGHAMKENGEYSPAYVIARAAEPVDWSTATQTINDSGTQRKHKKISVLFESFKLYPQDTLLTVGITNNELGITNEPIIDKNGNELALTHEGAIVVRKIVVLDLEIAKGGKLTIGKDASIEAFVGEGQIVGKAKISEGLTYVIVENKFVHPDSEIFLTLYGSPPKGITYAVANRKDGQFTIQLSEGAPYGLEFTYWILNPVSGFMPSNSATSTGP